METSTSGRATPEFDASQPLKGAVICCTSIPPNETKDIELKTINLGGIYTKDLTVDVTHLLVGDYDTPKYRHAAKSLAHARAMDAGWVEALTELWRHDAPIDFPALERAWQLRPLEIYGAPAPTREDPEPSRGRLLVCLTGFLNLEERTRLAERITELGGQYTGELNKQCTHLIAAKPEGQKYLAARKWGVRVVSLEWLDQSAERGMVLDERYFDPVLPPEERGKGARDDPGVTLGKRQRLLDSFAEPVDGGGGGPRRKLRKTASMKLSSQREGVWGDILGTKTPMEQPTSNEQPGAEAEEEPRSALSNGEGSFSGTSGGSGALGPADDGGIFSTSYVCIKDFEKRKHDILSQTLTALGARIFPSPKALSTARSPRTPWHRFIIVPQDSHQPLTSPPPSSPPAQNTNNNNTTTPTLVTEFFIERCIHFKSLLDPRSHVLGRPFPHFPLPSFAALTICSAGFRGVDLHHLALAVTQLGARFEETFRRHTSVLVCSGGVAAVRREKLKLALNCGIPVVAEEWLWECVAKGECVPLEGYMFGELRQRVAAEKKLLRTRSEPVARGGKGGEAGRFGVDTDAFGKSGEGAGASRKGLGTAATVSGATRYHTARSHIFDDMDDFSTKPSRETTHTTSRRESIPMRPSNETMHLTARDTLLPTTASSDEATLLRRQQQEKAEQEKAEQERREQEAQELLAFSSKLTSLIDTTTTAAAAANQPNSSGAEPGPVRRKRGILGRAASYVSAPAGSNPENQQDTRRVSVEGIGVGEGEEGLDGGEGSTLLTQVEYLDPGAAQARAEILGRMNGIGGAGDGAGASRRVRTS